MNREAPWNEAAYLAGGPSNVVSTLFAGLVSLLYNGLNILDKIEELAGQTDESIEARRKIEEALDAIE